MKKLLLAFLLFFPAISFADTEVYAGRNLRGKFLGADTIYLVVDFNLNRGYLEVRRNISKNLDHITTIPIRVDKQKPYYIIYANKKKFELVPFGGDNFKLNNIILLRQGKDMKNAHQ